MVGTKEEPGGLAQTTLKFVIAGGGIAGLAAAIALRHSGHEVTILERMPVVREVRELQ